MKISRLAFSEKIEFGNVQFVFFIQLHSWSIVMLGMTRGGSVEGARKMGFATLAFKVPHRMAIVEHCDEIAEPSEGIGAVKFHHLRGAEATCRREEYGRDRHL